MSILLILNNKQQNISVKNEKGQVYFITFPQASNIRPSGEMISAAMISSGWVKFRRGAVSPKTAAAH